MKALACGLASRTTYCYNDIDGVGHLALDYKIAHQFLWTCNDLWFNNLQRSAPLKLIKRSLPLKCLFKSIRVGHCYMCKLFIVI